MEERWAPFPIERFSLTHRISDSGRVQSKDRHVWKGRGRKVRTFVPGRIQPPSLMKIGYYRARPADKIDFYVHILVAMAFVPNPNNLPEVNHKDFDKKNNHWTNLEWVSHKENMHHAMRAKLNRRKDGRWDWHKSLDSGV